MSSTGMGSQYHSISSEGLSIFEQGTITSSMGSVTIDLATAPIPPGQYHLDIKTGMGGVEIYLPRYVQFTVDGNSKFGSKNIHEGLSWWKQFESKFQHTLHLANQIPDHAVAPHNPEAPVTIHFTIDTGMGGIDIYRL